MEIKVINDDVNRASKKLRRKLQQEGLFREMKRRRYYEKPSVRSRRKEKEAARRLRKKMRRMQKDY
jgi:small subunit ribosomal protein S21